MFHAIGGKTIEVFYDDDKDGGGWFWKYDLPSSEPHGPFTSYETALRNARKSAGQRE